MKSFWVGLVVLAWGSGWAGGAMAPDPATKLVYLTEDYPPANFMKEGAVQGASVEVLHLVWNKMGVADQPILLVPWARGYQEALNTPGTVLFSMSRQPSRESLFQWVGPIFVARHYLISRAASKLHLDSLGDAKRYVTAVVREDVSEISMREAGFRSSELLVVTTIPQALELMNAGRAQFACVSTGGFTEWTQQAHLDTTAYVRSQLVNTRENFFAFQKGTDPKLVARFQQALDAVRGPQLAILKKFGLSL